jgi:spermidine export protein MdtI
MAAFPAWTYILAVIISAGLDVAANLFLARSEGFRRLKYSSGAIFMTGLAFTFLAYAVNGMDLSVAYALWGGFGILGTSVGGWLLFGQRLHRSAWYGMALLIGGMTLLRING